MKIDLDDLDRRLKAARSEGEMDLIISAEIKQHTRKELLESVVELADRLHKLICADTIWLKNHVNG